MPDLGAVATSCNLNERVSEQDPAAPMLIVPLEAAVGPMRRGTDVGIAEPVDVLLTLELTGRATASFWMLNGNRDAPCV